MLWQLECGIRGIPPGEGRSDLQTEDQEPELTPLIDPGPLRDAYLSWLCELTSRVFLSGIDPKAASREKDACLSLGAIYTALFTQTAEHEEREASKSMERTDRRLSAVAQLNQHKHLVLLGDPGSGKSTFVNFAAMCLTGEALQRPNVNLNLLTDPLPDDDGKDAKERQSWDHSALMPIRVILRDFAARGLPPTAQPATAKHLWDFIASELKTHELSALVPYLKHQARHGGGILMLDGLDEVPEAEQRRTQIKQAVEDFTHAFPNCRVLVTSIAGY